MESDRRERCPWRSLAHLIPGPGEHRFAKLIGGHRMRNSDTFSLTVSSHVPLSPQFISALCMVCQDQGKGQW